MANELKFGSKVVFLNGLPLTLPVAASDPGSAASGDLYYNSTSGAIRFYNGSSWGPVGAGSVTSVALADGSTTPIYTISGSPVTGAGTLTFTLNTQNANTIFSGPVSGGAGSPGFRALVAADIPNLASTYLSLTGGTMTGAINMGTHQINALTDPSLAQDAATKHYVDTTTLSSTLMTTLGDMIYEGAGPTPTRLPIGSTNQVLTVIAGIPSWQTATVGANTALSNLTTTSINQDLLPSATNTRVLGSNTLTWSSMWVNEILSPGQIDFQLTTGLLFNNSGSHVADFTNNALYDNTADKSIDWQGRSLIDGGGTNIQLSWSTSGVELNQLTANTVPYLNASKILTSSAVTPTTLAFLDATSSVQTQLNSKLALAGGTMTGAINLGGFAPTNSTTPVNPNDLVNKSYVDNFINATSWKTAVLVATTGTNLTLSGEQTIDGTLTSASRILVKDQTTASQNGIYITGSGAWTRSTDMSTWAEFPAAAVFVEAGTVNADLGFVCTAQPGGTLGTTAVNFVQFSSAGSYTADNVTLQLVSGVFSVKAGGISNTQIGASAAIAFSKLAALTSGNILVGNASNVAASVAITGDITLSNAGLTAVAKIAGTTVSGTTGTGNVVFSASPTLTGTITAAAMTLSSSLTTNTIISPNTLTIVANSGANAINLEASAFSRSTDGTNFVTETYLDSTTLTDNSGPTAVTALQFAVANFSGEEISYVIKTGTSTIDTRIGTLRVTANSSGTIVPSLSDMYTESADCGVVWTATNTAGTISVSYTTTNQAANRTMRADVKQFRR